MSEGRFSAEQAGHMSADEFAHYMQCGLIDSTAHDQIQTYVGNILAGLREDLDTKEREYQEKCGEVVERDNEIEQLKARNAALEQRVTQMTVRKLEPSMADKKPPMPNVMIDLETMSREKNAAILSIGAVVFNIESHVLGREFHQNVTLSSCVMLGLHRSAETLNWWSLDENKEARDALTKNAVSLDVAIGRFLAWCGGEIIPWSNGSTFDLVILEHAIRTCNRKVPWRFDNESCYKTLRRMLPQIVVPRHGLKHNTLDDARYQARHLMAILDVVKSVDALAASAS